jgi:crossover junction endodeoxyribonuclease RuvC
MGVDPGTNFTGYGIVEVVNRKPRCVTMGWIDLSKFDDPYLKLRHIFERVSGIIDAYKPTQVAFESPFFGENVQSMLKLGRAQGVAMAAALTKGVPVAEYAPRKVKISVTGNGSATKEQVATMLKNILKLELLPKKLDATDGLAVAMCHYYESCGVIPKSTGKGWSEFVKNNPDRIKK